MIETVRFSIDGSHEDLRALLAYVGLNGSIIDYPARSVTYITLVTGTAEHASLESNINKFRVGVRRYRTLEASPEELASCTLFSNVGCRWIEDDESALEPPQYTGSDACPECGKGQREHVVPLTGKLTSLRKSHLVRKSPALVLVSSRLAALFEAPKWSGVEIRPVIEKTTGQESELFREAWVHSILPLMHPSAGLERSVVPQFCEWCKRVGFQLTSRQPVYAAAILSSAADWNLSTEWTAPHFVPCPKLICSRRVVHELLKLEPSQKWIPVKLVE